MSAVAKTFLDTNVLVYARDRSEISKGPVAERLLQRGMLDETSAERTATRV